jgi:hypothetical protein
VGQSSVDRIFSHEQSLAGMGGLVELSGGLLAACQQNRDVMTIVLRNDPADELPGGE